MTRRLQLLIALLLPLASAGAQVTQAEYAQRRAALAAKMSDGILLSIGESEPAMNFMNFFQGETFSYLTGFDEPDAALVITKQGNDVRTTLFVQPRNPAQEVWTGSRMGTTRVTQQMGIQARDIDQLKPTLDSALTAGAVLHIATEIGEAKSSRSHESHFLKELQTKYASAKVVDMSPTVAQLRAKKSPAELEYLRKAIAITVDAHREAMRAMEPGMNEFEIQSLISRDMLPIFACRSAAACASRTIW